MSVPCYGSVVYALLVAFREVKSVLLLLLLETPFQERTGCQSCFISRWNLATLGSPQVLWRWCALTILFVEATFLNSASY